MKANSQIDLRSRRMGYAHVMDDIKPISPLPALDVITLGMASEYLGLSQDLVGKYYNNHKKELGEYGITTLKVEDFTNAGYQVEMDSVKKCYNATLDGVTVSVSYAGVRVMSKLALFNMALGISGSEVAEQIKGAAGLAETESNMTENMAEPNEETNANTPVEITSDVQEFTNPEFGSVRTMEIDGEPWFVGKDVAAALGYKNTKDAISTHVEKEDKTEYILDNPDGKQKMVIINESGLYSLILSSRMPTARKFKDWILHTLIPNGRKTEKLLNATAEKNENNVVKTFTSPEFGSVRIIEENGKQLFCGTDVASALGYAIPRKAVREHTRGGLKRTIPTKSGNQEMMFIPEGDIYRLIIRSKLPSAERFERWVFDEVLPSLRKHGGYIVGQETMSTEELLSRALLVAQSKIEEKDAKIAEQSVTIQALAEDISTWDKRSVINALIRSFAGNCTGGNFAMAFSDFYRQFDYKFKTRLKSRRADDERKSLLDYLTEPELENAVHLAASMCENAGINVSSVVNEVNAGRLCHA